jgi:hypothetical protein
VTGDSRVRSARRTARSAAWFFIVFGVSLVLVGLLGLGLGWGTTTESVTTVHIRPAEAPQQFLSSFTTALRDGDRNFLLDRMDPAVIERYSTAQCQTKTRTLLDPGAQLQLLRVTGPEVYEYSSSGQTTRVGQVYTFNVTGSLYGTSATRDLHFALVDGKFRFFTDCGAS